AYRSAHRWPPQAVQADTARLVRVAFFGSALSPSHHLVLTPPGSWRGPTPSRGPMRRTTSLISGLSEHRVPEISHNSLVGYLARERRRLSLASIAAQRDHRPG